MVSLVLYTSYGTKCPYAISVDNEAFDDCIDNSTNPVKISKKSKYIVFTIENNSLCWKSKTIREVFNGAPGMRAKSIDACINKLYDGVYCRGHNQGAACSITDLECDIGLACFNGKCSKTLKKNDKCGDQIGKCGYPFFCDNKSQKCLPISEHCKTKLNK